MGNVITEEVKVWRHAYYGGKTAQQLIDQLYEGGCDIYVDARDLLRDEFVETSSEIKEVKLAKMSGGEIQDALGFSRYPCFLEVTTRHQVFRLLKEYFGRLCPAELGPHLLLQYLDIPYGYEGEIETAMDPIEDPGGVMRTFTLNACPIKDMPHLQAEKADDKVDAGVEYVFILEE